MPATIIADLPSTELAWDNEKKAMQHLGYTVLYDPALPPSTTDFTAQVVAMKSAGVQILFLEQEPQNYASAIFRDLDEQNFHPVVVLGAASYSPQLVGNAGGPDAVDGAYLEQATSLYLGEDAAQIPAITTFTTWVQKVSPGFAPDFFTLAGWLCAELFVDALRKAGYGPDPGLAPAGPAQDHSLRQWEPHPGEQPGRQGADHLLPTGPDRQREVSAARRSAGHRSHPWIPMRRDVLPGDLRAHP